MTTADLLALGEHPADIERVLARLREADEHPNEARRLTPCELTGDPS